jgi:DNA-directed RNA polymerase specialized sigma24 family protein
LDLKCDNAVNQFTLQYLEYHQKRASNDYEAAKEVGLKGATFKTRLRRVRGRLEKSMGESNS